MTKLTRFFGTCVLVVSLSGVALAGDVLTPPAPPPPPAQLSSSCPGTEAPALQRPGQMIAEQNRQADSGKTCCYRVAASAHGGAYLVQLASVNQVQALLSHALKARQDLGNRRLHHAPTSFVAREIEIKVLAHEAIRHPGKTV